MDLPKIKTDESKTIKETRKNKRKMSAKIIAILVLTVFITSAVTYGYFAANKFQTGNNTLLTECFNIDMTNESASINLSNAYPISNKKGQETTPYSFTLTNTCATTAKYYIIVDSKTNSFDDRYLNVSVNKELPETLSKRENTSYPADSGYQSSHIIKTGTLVKDASKDFEVRLWIDEATTYEQLTGRGWEGQVRIVSVVADIDKFNSPSGQTLAKLGVEVNENEPNFMEITPYTIITANSAYKNFADVVNDATYPYSYDEETGTYTSTNTIRKSTSEISFNLTESGQTYLCYEVGGGTYQLYINDEPKTSLNEPSNCIDLGNINTSDTLKVTYIRSSALSSGISGTKLKFYLSRDVNIPKDDSGVYSMEDDYGTSYYYRGNIKNNYVKFGKWNRDIYFGYATTFDTVNYKTYSSLEECQSATNYNVNCKIGITEGTDMWWRIIRVNGNGSLRVIYDGTTAHENGEESKDRFIGESQWNDIYDDAKYIGYMFGGANGEASTSKEQAQTNTTDSTIKTYIDTWYQENILTTGNAKYISDTLFCNDRSTVSTPSRGDPGLGYGQNATLFGYKNRLSYDMDNTLLTSVSPTLKCPQKNDTFTVKDKNLGNEALTYPVGLITADEASLSGGHPRIPNYNFYLYKGDAYFTISPASIGINIKNDIIVNEFKITDNIGDTFAIGYDNQGNVINNQKYAVAPVINLSSEFIDNMTGDGTMTNPYRLNGDQT